MAEGGQKPHEGKWPPTPAPTPPARGWGSLIPDPPADEWEGLLGGIVGPVI